MLSCFRLCATLWTVACQAPCTWDCPGKNTGVGWHNLLQGIVLTQGSNPCPLGLLPGRNQAVSFQWGHQSELGDFLESFHREMISFASSWHSKTFFPLQWVIFKGHEIAFILLHEFLFKINYSIIQNKIVLLKRLCKTIQRTFLSWLILWFIHIMLLVWAWIIKNGYLSLGKNSSIDVHIYTFESSSD